jgi:hypothetical protein
LVGKVNNTYADLQLVTEAQKQLEIEGQWRVRNALTIGKVRTIEAERRDEDLVYASVPMDAEVTIEYQGTTKKIQLEAADDA